MPNVKLPAPAYRRQVQGGASRARSGEREASKRNVVHIVPLDRAYKAGLTGHLPVKYKINNIYQSEESKFFHW
jgi:hypothetical protein